MIKICYAPCEAGEVKKAIKLFLAGGITNCPNWQDDVISLLLNKHNHPKIKTDLVVFNPRRDDFPIDDPNASEEQIVWEFNKLKDSDVICFWFSRGSLNPIVLYELGMWGNSRQIPIIIGVDKKYERIKDVEIQTKLARPDIKLVYTLEDFTERIIKEINNA